MIEGGVECGPNAVLAFAREGNRKFDVNLADMTETLTYPVYQIRCQVLVHRRRRDVAFLEQGPRCAGAAQASFLKCGASYLVPHEPASGHKTSCQTARWWMIFDSVLGPDH